MDNKPISLMRQSGQTGNLINFDNDYKKKELKFFVRSKKQSSYYITPAKCTNSNINRYLQLKTLRKAVNLRPKAQRHIIQSEIYDLERKLGLTADESSYEFEQMIKIYPYPSNERKLGNSLTVCMDIRKDRVVYQDKYRPHLTHGQLIFVKSEKFNPKGIAGDHGCGATLYELPPWITEDDPSLNILKERASTLPTGGSFWKDQFLSDATKSQVRNISFPPQVKRLHKSLSIPIENRIGSLGSGNHFIHVVKNDDRLNLVVHTGSRGAFMHTVDELSSDQVLTSKWNSKWHKTLQGYEKFAQLNRDSIAAYLITGVINPKVGQSYRSKINGPHTRVNTEFDDPIIQKNIITSTPDRLNLVLGSPQTGVSLIPPSTDPFIVHGSGPIGDGSGKFQPATEVGGKHLTSIFNFDRHTTAGGSTIIPPQYIPFKNKLHKNLQPDVKYYKKEDFGYRLIPERKVDYSFGDIEQFQLIRNLQETPTLFSLSNLSKSSGKSG